MPESPYSVFEIQPEWVLESEALGSKEKFWYRAKPGEAEWLFKFPQPNTGSKALKEPSHALRTIWCSMPLSAILIATTRTCEYSKNALEIIGKAPWLQPSTMPPLWGANWWTPWKVNAASVCSVKNVSAPTLKKATVLSTGILPTSAGSVLWSLSGMLRQRTLIFCVQPWCDSDGSTEQNWRV